MEEKNNNLQPEEAKQPEVIDFKGYLVPPHKKKSREVLEGDLQRVIADSHILYNLCFTQVGYIPGCFAVHHSQIDNKDPLNFFVTAEKKVIINPKIIRHTKVPIIKKEGCLTFPMNPPIQVERFNKCELECSFLTPEGTISPLMVLKLSGKDAEIVQHECDHADGKYIYKIYEEKNKDI